MAVRADDLLAQVATDLDRLMCARSLTQQALAARAGMSRARLNQVLKLVHEPRLSTVARLARVMGCRVEVRIVEGK